MKLTDRVIRLADSSFNILGELFMQVILIVVFFLVAIPLAFKFPKIVKAIFRGVFNFIIFFIKNLPNAINKANSLKRKE
ncbi:TPA: hypothetical protein ACSTNG_001813 [Serratia fonticola]